MQNQPSNRLAALAHYVIARTPADQLGATKLNKILWWVDCAAYGRWGRSLTGEVAYRRLPHGPVPEGIRAALELLKLNGRVVETQGFTPVGARREFHSINEPPVDQFSAEEIDLVAQIIAVVGRMSASEASELSHDALWEEVGPQGLMPVSAGSIVRREVRADDLEWARSELHRLAL